MFKNKLPIAIASVALSFVFVSIVSYAPISFGQVRIFTPSQGGTGLGSATAGDVGKFLSVSDDSPLTYVFSDAAAGSFSTTSSNFWASVGLAFSTTSTDYWKTQQTFTGASTTLLSDTNRFSTTGTTTFSGALEMVGGTGHLTSHGIRSDASDGIHFHANNWANVALFGAGNTSNALFYGGVNIDGATRLATSLTGLLKGTAGAITAATAGTDYENPLTFSYPISRSVNAVSLAFGTTTDNTWSGLQTFTNAGTTTFSGHVQVTGNLRVDGAFYAPVTIVSSGNTTINGDLTVTGTCTGCGAAWPFTPSTNYGVAVQSTSTPLWLTAGLHASSTSHFVNASTTLFSIDAGAFEAVGYPMVITSKGSSNNGTFIKTYFDSSSPAANDYLGGWDIYAKNSTDSSVYMGALNLVADDVTSGSEDAHWELLQIRAGVVRAAALSASSLTAGRTFTFPDISGTFCILNANCTGTSTAHSWTALQSFSNATSTLFTSTTAWIDRLTLTNASTTNLTVNLTQVIGDGSGASLITPTRGLTVPFGATTTAWTGTTTIRVGPAPFGFTINTAWCETNTGTLNVKLVHGATNMQMVKASSTIGQQTVSTNNAITKGTLITIDVGTPASTPTNGSCTFSGPQTSQ